MLFFSKIISTIKDEIVNTFLYFVKRGALFMSIPISIFIKDNEPGKIIKINSCYKWSVNIPKESGASYSTQLEYKKISLMKDGKAKLLDMVVNVDSDNSIIVRNCHNGKVLFRKNFPVIGVNISSNFCLKYNEKKQTLTVDIGTVEGKIFHTVLKCFYKDDFLYIKEIHEKKWEKEGFLIIKTMGYSQDEKMLFCLNCHNNLFVFDKKGNIISRTKSELFKDRSLYQYPKILSVKNLAVSLNNDNSITAVDFNKKEIVWTKSICRITDFFFMDPILMLDDYIVVISKGGELLVLDTFNEENPGSVKFNDILGSYIYGGFKINDNSLILTTHDHKLIYLFFTKDHDGNVNMENTIIFNFDDMFDNLKIERNHLTGPYILSDSLMCLFSDSGLMVFLTYIKKNNNIEIIDSVVSKDLIYYISSDKSPVFLEKYNDFIFLQKDKISCVNFDII
jgi:hypothetical protein